MSLFFLFVILLRKDYMLTKLTPGREASWEAWVVRARVLALAEEAVVLGNESEHDTCYDHHLALDPSGSCLTKRTSVIHHQEIQETKTIKDLRRSTKKKNGVLARKLAFGIFISHHFSERYLHEANPSRH